MTVTTAQTVVQEARAAAYMAQGYRRISGKHRMVSRIDRADWVELLANNINRKPEDVHRMVGQSPAAMESWEDYYRRVLSKDRLTIDPTAAKYVLTSGRDITGYVRPKSEVENIPEPVPLAKENKMGMEIEYTPPIPKNKTVPLTKIEYGSCFRLEGETAIFMKLGRTHAHATIELAGTFSTRQVTCLHLATGDILPITRSRIAIPLEVRLTVYDDLAEVINNADDT